MNIFFKREKDREIRNKLFSTYQYARHKRGKNPFQMLVISKKPLDQKTDKINTVQAVLSKTQKQPFVKSFHFMLPLQKTSNSTKIEEESKPLQLKKKSISSQIEYKQESYENDYKLEEKSSLFMNISTSDKKKRKKRGKSENKVKILKNVEMRALNNLIIKECEGIMVDDVNLKRQIDVGMNLKELESFIGNNIKIKEARILRDIKQFEQENKKKMEKIKRSQSEVLVRDNKK